MAEPNTPAPFRLTSRVAEDRILNLARKTANVALTRHAKVRMAEREITMTDIYRVLRHGGVKESPQLTERGDWKCMMTMPLRGRRTAGVAVALKLSTEKLVVLTVEWEDEK